MIDGPEPQVIAHLTDADGQRPDDSSQIAVLGQRVHGAFAPRRPPLDDVAAVLAEAAEYAALGVTEVQVTPDRHPVEFAQRLGDEVVPRLAELG